MNRFVIYFKNFLRRTAHPALIVFLLISFVLWYINKLSHDYTATVTVPVSIENNPNSALGVIENSQEVECLIEGAGYRLLTYKLFPKRHRAAVDISRVELRPVASGDRNEVTIGSLYNALAAQITDVKVLSVLTPRFEIVASPVKSKRVPVLSRIRIEYDPRFMPVSPLVLIPDSLTVQSLDVLLDTLRGVYTVPRSFTEVHGSLSGKIPLSPIPDVLLPVDEVRYDIRVEEYTETDLTLPIEVRNYPDRLSPVIIPSEAVVRVNVRRSDYANASPEHIRLYINYGDRASNLDRRYKIRAETTEGIVVREIIPLYAELLFEKN